MSSIMVLCLQVLQMPRTTLRGEVNDAVLLVSIGASYQHVVHHLLGADASAYCCASIDNQDVLGINLKEVFERDVLTVVCYLDVWISV